MTQLSVLTDICYSTSHERCVFDLFRPAGRKKAPLVILIHGGGWRAGHRIQYHQTCIRLANEGYAAATVGYRLVPDFPPNAAWPEIAYDVLRGAAYLREHASELGIDATRTVTWGSSAGGHLALMLQAFGGKWVNEGIVKAIPEIIGTVAQCPATHIAEEYDKGGYRKPMMSGHPKEEVSPAHIDPRLFRSVFVAHGDTDEVIPIEQSQMFVERLKSVEVEVNLEVIAGAEHGFSYNLLSPHAQKCLSLALPYVKKCFDNK